MQHDTSTIMGPSHRFYSYLCDLMTTFSCFKVITLTHFLQMGNPLSLTCFFFVFFCIQFVCFFCHLPTIQLTIPGVDGISETLNRVSYRILSWGGGGGGGGTGW